jgi:hypothetical protein
MICPDCEEMVADGFAWHQPCCPHYGVDTSDDADGVAGNGATHVWRSYCHDCGADVEGEPDEDGGIMWEVVP